MVVGSILAQHCLPGRKLNDANKSKHLLIIVRSVVVGASSLGAKVTSATFFNPETSWGKDPDLKSI
jgi:hypothetical protein